LNTTALRYISDHNVGQSVGAVYVSGDSWLPNENGLNNLRIFIDDFALENFDTETEITTSSNFFNELGNPYFTCVGIKADSSG